MPRDPRPYTTYPLNYTSHPRIESLSDPAFRAFHEMNDYSRVHGLDGVIPLTIARKRWPAKVLAELVTGIDDRPLVEAEFEAYVLRSYSDHQFTTADAAALRSARAEAGRKGGEAKARARQAASNGVAIATAEGQQILPESESESELDDFFSPSTSQSRDKRASVVTDSIPISATTQRMAKQSGIRNLRLIVDAIGRHCGMEVTADEALQVSLNLLGKAKTYPDHQQPYVLTAVKKSPLEVQQFLGRAS